MVDGCASHDVQTVIRLLHDRDVSLSRLASALRIPGRYLRLADRPWERSQTNA
jgi:hypothetical protein